jgi:hypothetical protein
MLIIAALSAHAHVTRLAVYGQLPNGEMVRLSCSGERIALVPTIGAERLIVIGDLES